MKTFTNWRNEPLNVYRNVDQFQAMVRSEIGEYRQVVFVDGDDVIFNVLNDEVLVNPKAKKALEWLKKEGYFVVLWTGAGKSIIPHVINHWLDNLIDLILYDDNYVIKNKEERIKVFKKLFDRNSDLRNFEINRNFSFEEKIGYFTAGVKLFFLLYKNALLIEDSRIVSSILFNNFGADPSDMNFASVTNYQRTMQVLVPWAWNYELEESNRDQLCFSVKLLKRYLDPRS